MNIIRITYTFYNRILKKYEDKEVILNYIGEFESFIKKYREKDFSHYKEDEKQITLISDKEQYLYPKDIYTYITSKFTYQKGEINV